MERLVRGWLFVAAVTQVITGKKKKTLDSWTFYSINFKDILNVF